MKYEYKSISLPWLSKIPAHWNLVRNKTVLHETKDTVGVNHADYQLLSLTKGGVIIRDLSTGKGKFPSDFGTYKIVSEGQIIFCLFDIDETPRTVGLSKYCGMITGAYDVFAIEGINPRYLEYYYLSLDDVKAMRPLYTGLRKVIGVNAFMQTHLPLPPREEQDQIVRYLDWKVSQTNKLINAKHQQIALLQEKKKSFIHRTVTKGINPSVRFKDSGEKWIGETPENWPTKPISKISTVVRGASPRPAGSPRFFNGNHTPWITVGELTKDDEMLLTSTESYLTADGVQHSRFIEKGTLLFTNSGATLGVPKISAIDGCINDGSVALLDLALKKEYLYFVLKTRTSDLLNQVSGYGQPNLNTTIVKSIVVPVPSECEQTEIATFLEEFCAKIDQIISDLHSEITLFAEYRTRLISDVVTGKKDVRNVVMPQYEVAGVIIETDENEIEEEI